jgi:3-hydroxyisobutyrate dehydrogenase-like beta-hydroxyacid dehydrogenase
MATATESKADVAFVGTGSMGMPMVERLLRAGHRVLTCARSAEAGERLRRLGAELTGSPAEAVARTTTTVTCVFSLGQLRQVLVADGLLDRMAAGHLLVNHVTVSARAIQELASRADARGVYLVDAPVSGTPAMIREGRLTVLLGGDPGPVARARAVTGAYADPILETGPAGSATRLKLLNNALFAAHAQIAEAALEMARAWNLDASQVVDVLTRCSGTSGALAHLHREGAATMAPTEKYLRKDVAELVADLADAPAALGVIGTVIREGPLRIG